MTARSGPGMPEEPYVFTCGIYQHSHVHKDDYDALRSHAEALREECEAWKERYESAITDNHRKTSAANDAIERAESAESRAAELEQDAMRFRAACDMIGDNTAFGFYLNANDTFGYACADSVEADTTKDFTEVVDIYLAHGYDGVLAWMETKTGNRVLKELRGRADAGHAAISARSKG